MSAGLFESARNLLTGLLDLGRTRFELFSTELREEMTRLAAAIIGGMAIVICVLIGLVFGTVAIILSVGEAYRVGVTVGAAVFFLVAAGVIALVLKRVAAVKPRPFEATLSELQRDVSAIRS
jgi:uncharacterized membrane protein YqjE